MRLPMAKEKRSNKWAFLLYQESAPENYLDILEEMHIPFILSPWHDKDVNKETGEFKKAHKHGALYFDARKSYSQFSQLVTKYLNTPAHVEVIMSPKGMYDYFTHAENPEKTPYNINDIESGCGFDLDKFLITNNSDEFLTLAIDIIEEHNFLEFNSLVRYARTENPKLLSLIMNKTYFFAKYLDSRRYNNKKDEGKYKHNKLVQIEQLLKCLLTSVKQNQKRQNVAIVTQKELLDILQISPNTLKSWERTGLKRLEPPIERTRTVYYKLDDVINYLTP